MPSPTYIDEFTSLLSNCSLLFVVFYRGHWCPFCQAYLRALQGLSPRINAVGGKTLIVTSQPSGFLPEMRKISGYSGDAIVDPENTLVRFVKERYDLEIAVTEKKGYEHGMAQPGFLVLRGGRRSDMIGDKGSVIEKWAIVPSTMNLGGASDRPELEQVWDNAMATIEGKGVVHTAYTKIGFLRMLWGKVLGR